MEAKHKTRIGRVVSDKMDKTIVVGVEVPMRHPLYKKVVKRVIKYKVHDEKNEAKTGDVVMIIDSRPASKEKRWRLHKIVNKAEVVVIKPQEVT